MQETLSFWLRATLLCGLGLTLLFLVPKSLLLLFAGVLVATLLDAGVRLLRVPIGRAWRLAFVVLVVLGLVSGGLSWGGTSLLAEAASLESTVREQADNVASMLRGMDLPLDLLEDTNSIEDLMPSHTFLAEVAGSTLLTGTGVLLDVAIVLLLGVFLAISPNGYKQGLLLLFPPNYRPRLDEVLSETGHKLQAWIVGQAAAMLLVGISVWGILEWFSVPNALALGAVTGLLNFIPFLGPIIAALPISLVAFSQGLDVAVWVMVAFLVVQWIEGYIITPLIQHRIVDLPPAHSLVTMMIMGSLFGELGVALATPLLAVGRVTVLRLYVDDVLERQEQLKPQTT